MTVRTQKEKDGRPKVVDGELDTDSDGSVNEVRLVGRLAAEPVTRTLPSGDRLVTFRLIVGRRPGGRSTVTVDSLECSAWTARVQRNVLRWRPGDVVEVAGSIRRRFFRGAGGAASRVEIEVSSGRIRRRPRDA